MIRPTLILLVTSLVFLACSAAAFSQQRFQIAAQATGAVFAHNSENDLPLLQDRNFLISYGIDGSFGYEVTGDYAVVADFIYYRSDALLSFNYAFGDPRIEGSYSGDVLLDEYSADFDLRLRANSWLRLGVGPSLGIVERTIQVSHLDIYDRIDSYMLGGHVVADTKVPFNKDVDRGLFWFYSLKVRYLHSLFFDARGRDLGNYRQSFLTTSLAAGIGYAF